MLTQRWLFKTARFRPAHEVINPTQYEVAAIGSKIANTFVKTHHYSGTGVYDRYRYGLFRAGHLVGTAIFSHPTNERILSIFGSRDVRKSMELGRFVLLDQVPGNGETWFLGHCFRLLRTERDAKTGELLKPHGVVAFSDPVPRRNAQGILVMPGHRGVIYQAHNASYLGRATRRTLYLWPDGRCVNSRRMQKIRSGEAGSKSAIEEFKSFGADEPWDDRTAWMKHWLGQLTTKLPHPGNFKYAWALSDLAKQTVPHSLPYPKDLQ
jgi:hypothetical protein